VHYMNTTNIYAISNIQYLTFFSVYFQKNDT